MNDFDGLLLRVLEQARGLHIPVSGRIDPHVVVNRRAVSRFGCCVRRPDGSFAIELSHRLLEAEEGACLQTLAHEVLHTCPGCRNHGERWKAHAARMNEALGYEIARTGSCRALGVADDTPVRHLVVCRSCGAQFRRAKASRLVQYPERYRCKCGGTLERRF